MKSLNHFVDIFAIDINNINMLNLEKNTVYYEDKSIQKKIDDLAHFKTIKLSEERRKKTQGLVEFDANLWLRCACC